MPLEMTSEASDALAEISSYYNENYSHIVETLESRDVLGYSPDVHNQLRMAYSHLSRCMQSESSDVMSDEKNRAIDHIKRGALDAHKTVYYSNFCEMDVLLEKCLQAPIERIETISGTPLVASMSDDKKTSRRLYVDAKMKEAEGDHGGALDMYRRSLEIQDILLDDLSAAQPEVERERKAHKRSLANAVRLSRSAIIKIAITVVTFLLAVLPIPYQQILQSILQLFGG